MYFCPTCGKQFDTVDTLVAHYVKCWKEQNPNHKSKPAPRSEDINTVEVSNDILNFFSSFQ